MTPDAEIVCPDCGDPGMLIPCRAHPRADELPQELAALICMSCGARWTNAETEIVACVWAGELQRQVEGSSTQASERPMRFDEQRRCQGWIGGQRCERRDDHDGEHAIDLRDGHGNPWEQDQCFHFSGGNGTRCVLLYGHRGSHITDRRG